MVMSLVERWSRRPGANVGERRDKVPVGGMAVASERERILITYSLGSCIGITVYDPVAVVGGLAHCMLPAARGEADKRDAEACKFVTTGVPRLLEAVYGLGARPSRLVIKLAGAGSPLADSTFDIGKRNYAMMRKLLWKNDLLIAAENVGGKTPRTMRLYMDSGLTSLETAGVETQL